MKALIFVILIATALFAQAAKVQDQKLISAQEKGHVSFLHEQLTNSCHHGVCCSGHCCQGCIHGKCDHSLGATC